MPPGGHKLIIDISYSACYSLKSRKGKTMTAEEYIQKMMNDVNDAQFDVDDVPDYEIELKRIAKRERKIKNLRIHLERNKARKNKQKERQSW